MSNLAWMRYRTHDVGRIEVVNVTAQQALDGGVFIFHMRAVLQGKSDGRRLTLHGVTGTANLTQPAALLGTAYAFNTLREDTQASERECTFSIASHFSSPTIRALERLREESVADSMTVQLRLDFACGGPEGPDTVQAWVEKDVPHSTWLEFLKQVRFEDRHAIEIPIAGGRVGASFSVAAEHYRRGLAYLTKHDWVGATAEARKTTEEIRDRLGLKPPPSAEWADRPVREAWTLGQRIEHARVSIHHVFHLANHPGVSDDPGPHEAKLAVHLAGVLLAYYSSRHV